MTDFQKTHSLGVGLATWLSVGARTHRAWIRMLSGYRSRFEARTFAGSAVSGDAAD